ncbi:glycosyl hydrolase [Sorangium sp. So ce216]
MTPNATQATKNVLCYLHSIYGNHILSAQEEDNNDDGMNTIHQATGKYPAIRAFDVNNDRAPTQCVEHWNQGGLCMFGYHMGINGQRYDGNVDMNNVLREGTAENRSLDQNLDRVAQYIEPLRAAGGVAILRLFHEAGNGCGWFWWGKGSAEQYRSLFKYAFDYLTGTKGLDNVLWMVPLCGHPDRAYDVGPQYSDIGGADTYVQARDYGPLTDLFHQTESAFPGRIVALHECGSIPDPEQLRSTGTKWLLFNVWANPFFKPEHNPPDHLRAVYTSDYVITLDELPSFE